MRQSTEVIELDGLDHPVSARDIVQRQSPYVALLREKKLDGLIDREQLASQVARNALQ